ncbi:type II CAAX endopeptidase family protein [Paenibacillus sp. FSL E2-0202]|uniref:CPBP family intramembrane glutamic endopeptidase n=1 Tax=Paenibacillus sp. FSL E2-0202 TaxID=2954505 RepID=UPI0030EEAF00
MIDEKLSKRQLILGVILAVMYFLGLFSILLIRPVMEILNHVFIWQPEQQNRMALMLNSLIYIGVIIGFRGFYKQAIHDFRQYWVRNMLWMVWGLCLIIIIGSMLIPTLIFIFHPITKSVNEVDLRAMLSSYPFIFTVNVVWIGPLIEELVYRVTIYRTIRRKSRLLAYLISSFLFGFQHVYRAVVFQSNYNEMWNIFSYMAAGLIFAYLYEKRKNILVPIGAHMFSNGLSVLLYFLS